LLFQRVRTARAAQGADGFGGLSLSRSTAPLAIAALRGSGGYAAGEQRRDFVFVDDVVAVSLDFLGDPGALRNLQCRVGRAQTFNEVAVATINACRAGDGQAPRRWWMRVAISTSSFRLIRGKYQVYAAVFRAALAGYRAPMTSGRRGVATYVDG
jgi:ADP-L-glycero-D-manno-heptose 6-epimerase